MVKTIFITSAFKSLLSVDLYFEHLILTASSSSISGGDLKFCVRFSSILCTLMHADVLTAVEKKPCVLNFSFIFSLRCILQGMQQMACTSHSLNQKLTLSPGFIYNLLMSISASLNNLLIRLNDFLSRLQSRMAQFFFFLLDQPCNSHLETDSSGLKKTLVKT